jgi:hypothetical protein
MYIVSPYDNIPVERKVSDLNKRVEILEVNGVPGGGEAGNPNPIYGTVSGNLTVNGTGMSKIMGNLTVEGTSTLKGTVKTNSISTLNGGGNVQVNNGLTATELRSNGSLLVQGSAAIMDNLVVGYTNVGNNIDALIEKTGYLSYTNPNTIITTPLKLKGANENLRGMLKTHAITGEEQNDAHEGLVITTTSNAEVDQISGHINIRTGSSLGGGEQKRSGNVNISTGIVGEDERGITGSINLTTGSPMGDNATRGDINLNARRVVIPHELWVGGSKIEGAGGEGAVQNFTVEESLTIGAGDGGVTLTAENGHLFIGGVEIWCSE